MPFLHPASYLPPARLVVTVDEWLAKAAWVAEHRFLKDWQASDLEIVRRCVLKQGWVGPLDAYYLDIVGVPATGPIAAVGRVSKPGNKKARLEKAGQDRLF